MVKYDQAATDRVFGALSHPLRREILTRLHHRPGLSSTELMDPFVLTMPAMHKHLGVLVDAGLVKKSKVGRTTAFVLAPDGFRHASRWLAQYELFWSHGLDRLARLVEES